MSNITLDFPNNEDVLLSRFEVAKFLNVSLVTLHNLKVKGILLPTHKVGRKPLYLKSEILRKIKLN